MVREHEIVFEDLHGSNEDEPITIDLDAGSKDDGITRSPTGQVAVDDDRDDDSIRIDNLRSADRNDGERPKPEADAKDDDDDAAIKAGEDDVYSKKVKARIDREARAKRKERERADYWESQARKFAKDQFERERATTKSRIEQTVSAIEDTQTQLEKAIEDGQTKDQVRLTARLTDLKADKVMAEASLDNLSPDGNVQPFSGNVDGTGKPNQSLADGWTEEHSDWYGARGFERQTRLANRLDKEVFEDGYDPKSPDYFEELNRRIKEKEPKLFEALESSADDTGKDDKDDKPDKRRGKPVVAPVGGNENSRQRTSSSRVELTEDDFRTMRQFNLDTNDPEVLKEFARNKREAEQGARR